MWMSWNEEKSDQFSERNSDFRQSFKYVNCSRKGLWESWCLNSADLTEGVCSFGLSGISLH